MMVLGRCLRALSLLLLLFYPALLLPCRDKCGCFLQQAFPTSQHQPVTHLLSLYRGCGAAPAAPGSAAHCCSLFPSAPPSRQVDCHPGGVTPPSIPLLNAKSKSCASARILVMSVCSSSSGGVWYNVVSQLPLPRVCPGFWTGVMPSRDTPCISGSRCCGRAAAPASQHCSIPPRLPQNCFFGGAHGENESTSGLGGTFSHGQGR